MTTVSLRVNVAWMALSAWMTFSLAVVVITDLHVGAGVPQVRPPSALPSVDTSSSSAPANPDHLVQVRVTSGRFGGRFFYRVSETNLPTDLYTVVLPLSFMHHHLPYPLIRAPAPTVPQLQDSPWVARPAVAPLAHVAPVASVVPVTESSDSTDKQN